jgi:hypothetical protein
MYRSMSYGKISRKAVDGTVTDATFAGRARGSSGPSLCENSYCAHHNKKSVQVSAFASGITRHKISPRSCLTACELA